MHKAKLTLVIFLLAGVSNIAIAQFDGTYSQYMHLQHYYNPAAVGEQELMKVLLAQRLQWIGIKGAPKTTLFTVNTPFKVRKTNHAAGIRFVSDIFGIYTNQQINLQYAYKFKLEFATISVGADIGVINIICNGDSVHINASEYHSEANADPAIPIGKQSGTGFDLGLAAYMSNRNFYAGISILHVPGANLALGDKYHFKVRQLLTATGGYNFNISGTGYTIKPSILLYSDFVSWQAYASVILDYKNKFWGGLSYSFQNAVSFSFGAEIINGLDIGYCFDLPASSIIRSTHGSHEIYLSYDFNIFKQKTNLKHKSIRIL